MKRTLLFALSFSFTLIAWGNPPATLKLSQAHWAVPSLTAYLDVRNAEGQEMTGLQPAQLTASLGDTPLAVRQIQPFGQTGEGVAYIFLVDVSLSVKPEQFAKIRAALASWTEALTDADRMALLGFGDSVAPIIDFTADKAKLKQAISLLQPHAKQTTLHQGLIQAEQWGRRADAGLPLRRAIVLLSDGLDDMSGGPSQEEVLAQMAIDRTPLYAMGLAVPKSGGAQEAGSKALGLFARSSGGDYVGVGKQALAAVYANLRQRIRQVAVVSLDCGNCLADGRVQRLQITLQDSGLALSDGLDVRTLPPLPPPQPKTPDHPAAAPIWRQPWIYIGVPLVGLLLVIGVFFSMRRQRPVEPPLAQDADSGATLPVFTPVALPPVPNCRVRLVELGSKGRGHTYEVAIADQAVIGRGSQCAVPIVTDPEISNHHCALIYQNQAIFLRDLGSTNGSQVNGVPISSDYCLQEGDVIGIGRTQLRILILGVAL